MSMRFGNQKFIQVFRLLSLERFVCEEADFKINAFFDREPVEFFKDRFNMLAPRGECDCTGK